MEKLVSIPINTLRRAAAKLARRGRNDGVERALWIAARNYRAQRGESIELPDSIVQRALELTGAGELTTEEGNTQ